MNWRIFVDTTSKNIQLRNRTDANFGEYGDTVYRLVDRNRRDEMKTVYRRDTPGGEYVETQNLKPELPPGFVGMVPIFRVTGMGAPPHQNITPGLYEIEGASAEVKKNGEKHKIELTADSCEKAWELYKLILKNETSARVVSYAA